MTRRPDEQVAEWHRQNKAGSTIDEIAAQANVSRGVVSGALSRYRRINALPNPGPARTRSASSLREQATAERLARPMTSGITKVERDGVTVWLCPPGFAIGYGWSDTNE